jgi:hypothetical protein
MKYQYNCSFVNKKKEGQLKIIRSVKAGKKNKIPNMKQYDLCHVFK